MQKGMPPIRSRVAVLTAYVATATASPECGFQLPTCYASIGTVVPKNATSISQSTWSVGAETMDRNYTIYDNWR
jgi:hypothetical protein